MTRKFQDALEYYGARARVLQRRLASLEAKQESLAARSSDVRRFRAYELHVREIRTGLDVMVKMLGLAVLDDLRPTHAQNKTEKDGT